MEIIQTDKQLNYNTKQNEKNILVLYVVAAWNSLNQETPPWSSPEATEAALTTIDGVESVGSCESEIIFISRFGITGALVLRVTVIFNPSVVWIVAPVVMSTYYIAYK